MRTIKLIQRRTNLFVLIALLSILGTENVFAEDYSRKLNCSFLNDDNGLIVGDHDGQKNSEHLNGPGLSTYKGKFEMPGFGYYHNRSEIQSAKKEGVAQYNYRDSEDLTRIFEGNFFFAGSEEDLSLLMREDIFALLKNISDFSSERDIKVVALLAPFAIGEFKDDKQVGKWAWAYWADKELFVYKEISFDEYGHPQGFAKQYHYIINFGEFWHDMGYQNKKSIYEPTGWVIGEFDNNMLVLGNYRYGYKESDNDRYYQAPEKFGKKYEDLYHVNVSGKFNYRGPCGKWTVSGDYFTDNGKYTVVEFDDNGTCIANYWIDQSTGDKKYPQYLNSGNNPIQYIKQARSSIYNMVYSSCFRSTKMQE